ncbi:MAG: flagellar basal body L-ring protein FlgH [Fidelibacterota bacterium]
MKMFIKSTSLCVAILLMVADVLTAQGFPSLYADLKAREVGDVVTVLIVEQANASRESSVNNSSRTDASAESSVSGNLSNFLPVFGARGSTATSFDGNDGTKQKEQLTGKITATIVEDMGKGLFSIYGERLVNVNGEENMMQLQGTVRSRDILNNNTIYSYNIADATISYKKTGLANKVGRPGWGQRWLSKAMIGGLVVMSIMRAN